MTPLEEIIRAEIRASGPMRFDRFMEMALYHPGSGYYAKTERALADWPQRRFLHERQRGASFWPPAGAAISSRCGA